MKIRSLATPYFKRASIWSAGLGPGYSRGHTRQGVPRRMRRSWDCSVVSLDVCLLIRRREATQSSQLSFWKNEKQFKNRSFSRILRKGLRFRNASSSTPGPGMYLSRTSHSRRPVAKVTNKSSSIAELHDLPAVSDSAALLPVSYEPAADCDLTSDMMPDRADAPRL